MLTIHALERNAEERESLISWLQHLLHEDTPDIEFIPRVDLRPVSPDEIKFHGTPDICIVGPNILEEELTQLGKIRKLLPTTPIIAVTTARLEGLAQIEQIARLGATDTLSQSDSAATLLRKLVLLSKHKAEKKGGKLIVVDSGKGGIGVTSLAAALAEVSALEDKKTVLVDFDFETQDLSRFLQTRPFINENFQLLLEGSRTLSEEFVNQCIQRVWEDDEFLYHVSPPPESDALYAADTKMLRTLLSFFEVLDEKFDCVIVDAGSARGALQKTLYRAADHVLFVINNDPATLYSSVDRMKKVKEFLSPSASLTVVDNGGQSGLSRKMLLQEFGRAAKISEDQWHPTGIPFCKNGSKWPASGGTFASLAKNASREAVEALAHKLGLIEERSSAVDSIKSLLSRITERRVAIEIGTQRPSETQQLGTTKQIDGSRFDQKALPLPKVEMADREAIQKEVVDGKVVDKSQESLFQLVKGDGADSAESLAPIAEKGEKEELAQISVSENGAAKLEATDLISKATLH